MVLKAISGEFSVCSLTGMVGVSLEDEFCFLSRTDEELSLVCRSERVPLGARKVEGGWRMFLFPDGDSVAAVLGAGRRAHRHFCRIDIQHGLHSGQIRRF